MSTCKWAIEADLLMQSKSSLKDMTWRELANAHDKCNELIDRLRCGNRKWTHCVVRHQLRDYRERIARRLYDIF
jgi:hypothetical protein